MTEQIQGAKFHSYNLTGEVKLNIDELIYMLNVQDLPLLTGVGSNGMAILPRLPVDNRVFYWLEEDVPLPRGTLNEALDTSETGIDLVAGHGVRFAVGDIIIIDSEVMAVTANASDTLTVTRAAAGSSAANHSTAAEVLGLGTMLQEGEIGVGNFRGRDQGYNYTQIFSKKIEVTRTEQKIPKYGVPNELAKQVNNNMLNLNVGIEQALVYGVRYDDTGTSQLRSTGGMISFVTTNVDSTSTYITVDVLQTQQQVAYDAGGMFDILMARSSNFAALDAIGDSTRIHTVEITDPRRGRVGAKVVMTELGDVNLVRNRWMRKNNALAYNRDQSVLRVFDPLTLTRLAKTKDTDSFMMLTELGLEFKGQAHAVKWTALDATATFPTSLV